VIDRIYACIKTIVFATEKPVTVNFLIKRRASPLSPAHPCKTTTVKNQFFYNKLLL
jgi:hypothetical protein